MSRFISKSTEDDIVKILAKSTHPIEHQITDNKKKMTTRMESMQKMMPKSTNSIKRGHGLQVDPAPGWGRGLQVGNGLQVGGSIIGRGIIDPRSKNDLYGNNYM